MGSGELWPAWQGWGPGGSFHQDPSNPPFSPYFLFPQSHPTNPTPLLRNLLPDRKRKTVEIQTIILIHETSAFVMRFCNMSRVESVGGKMPEMLLCNLVLPKNNVIGQHNHSSRFGPIPFLGRTDKNLHKNQVFCLIKCLRGPT